MKSRNNKVRTKIYLLTRMAVVVGSSSCSTTPTSHTCCTNTPHNLEHHGALEAAGLLTDGQSA